MTGQVWRWRWWCTRCYYNRALLINCKNQLKKSKKKLLHTAHKQKYKKKNPVKFLAFHCELQPAKWSELKLTTKIANAIATATPERIVGKEQARSCKYIRGMKTFKNSLKLIEKPLHPMQRSSLWATWFSFYFLFFAFNWSEVVGRSSVCTGTVCTIVISAALPYSHTFTNTFVCRNRRKAVNTQQQLTNDR